jgi:hypothetical protein
MYRLEEMLTLQEAVTYYKNSQDPAKHKVLYEAFAKNASSYKNGVLANHSSEVEGFGELSFHWNWYLLVNIMPADFKFLEIGVYKGRVLSLIQMLSQDLGKQARIWGVTPLATAGDKFSMYKPSNYLDDIKSSYTKSGASFDSTTIVKGYSQDPVVIQKVGENATYDIIFIDGCHDYPVVCQDIDNYSPMLKRGGFLVLDDASSLLPGSYGQFLGHEDVGRAVQDKLDGNTQFAHLFAVGHNRVWLKL